MTVAVHHADCRELVKTLADNSVDACVTDPPYSLVSIQKRFGKPGSAPAKSEGASGVYKRASAGFMGQQWDVGEVAFDPEFWADVLRTMKPGAHLLAFGGTRTYHRLACAIEDAGFEIRDAVMWHYGTGFPKSHDVAKAIDKAARGVPHGGADPTSPHHDQYKTSATEGKRGDGDAGQGFGAGPGQFMAVGKPVRRIRPGADQQKDGSWEKLDDRVYQPHVYVPGTPEAERWRGWGTALKPATEIIVLARKPLDGTVAENVLEHGTGAINIDGCRIDASGRPLRIGDYKETDSAVYAGRVRGDDSFRGGSKAAGETDLGRWPANLCHDGSDEVAEAFAAFGDRASGTGAVKRTTGAGYRANAYGAESRAVGTPNVEYGDSGSASRFFFSGKAGKQDRWGSKHPTVKPVELIRWLCRLVTPPGGMILDPFAGSGTTGAAAIAEGFSAILIEREAAYVADIEERLAHYRGEGRHSLAAKNRSRTGSALPDDGLFRSVPPDEAA